MKTLNLAYPDRSDIEIRISHFPDGQQTVDIMSAPGFLRGEDIKLYSRIRTFRDLEIIIAANQALRDLQVASVSLYVPYFLGARSDRRFQSGGVNYLKQVICPIINAQQFDCVMVLDPHSDVLEACLDRFEKISNSTVVKYALADIDNRDGAQNRICLISPDGGALKKIWDVAEQFKIHNVVTAQKHRDIDTGKITHTEVPALDHAADVKYVVVDDICDGGRTFIELAKAIRAQRPDAEIHLVVTHGIFSNGVSPLLDQFASIHTTNSVKDHELVDSAKSTIFKQFNVF
jgi:ribose-phosphate pyrophosphokinase